MLCQWYSNFLMHSVLCVLFKYRVSYIPNLASEPLAKHPRSRCALWLTNLGWIHPSTLQLLGTVEPTAALQPGHQGVFGALHGRIHKHVDTIFVLFLLQNQVGVLRSFEQIDFLGLSPQQTGF